MLPLYSFLQTATNSKPKIKDPFINTDSGNIYIHIHTAVGLILLHRFMGDNGFWWGWGWGGYRRWESVEAVVLITCACRDVRYTRVNTEFISNRSVPGATAVQI
jgi:hypothetical protein